MKQTAVQFLLSHMWTTDWVNYTREEKLEVIEEAKQLEKQQIIEARNDMQKKCINLANKINPFLFEFNEKDSEQYYNETFKK